MLTINTYATEVLPMESRTAPAKVERVANAGLSSLYDALAAALLRVSEPGRRHLVIALTKAEDTISTIDGQSLTDLHGARIQSCTSSKGIRSSATRNVISRALRTSAHSQSDGSGDPRAVRITVCSRRSRH